MSKNEFMREFVDRLSDEEANSLLKSFEYNDKIKSEKIRKEKRHD